MFGEDILQHSSVYQEIVRRGQIEGEALGRAEGEREGAELLLLGVLESRFGAVPAEVRVILDRCPLATLRSLAGAATSAPSMAAFAEAVAERAPAE